MTKKWWNNKRGVSRRGFLGRSAGAAALAGFWADDTIEAYQNNVQTASKPSDLKITDMRVAMIVGAPMTCPIIRIDTNQGIYGLRRSARRRQQELRADAEEPHLLGENPCNVDKIFRKIKQFGGHARQGGGVCGIEMALWDLAGKAYNVPVYQMLGGKFRDQIRLLLRTRPNRTIPRSTASA